MPPGINLDSFGLDYESRRFGSSLLIHADCFDWMGRLPANSFHAIVTDPPYGVKEYDFDQLTKRTNGNGGIWRIPPSFDGHARSPLPRFTALNPKEREQLRRFFVEWAKLAVRILRPGGHLFRPVMPFSLNSSFLPLSQGDSSFAERSFAWSERFGAATVPRTRRRNSRKYPRFRRML